jgi:hypothetical protein
LLKNAHLLFCPHPSSLRRTRRYASLHRISGAPDVFEQPANMDFFSILLRTKHCAKTSPTTLPPTINTAPRLLGCALAHSPGRIKRNLSQLSKELHTKILTQAYGTATGGSGPWLEFNALSCYRASIVRVLDLHEFRRIVGLFQYFRRRASAGHDQFDLSLAFLD